MSRRKIVLGANRPLSPFACQTDQIGSCYPQCQDVVLARIHPVEQQLLTWWNRFQICDDTNYGHLIPPLICSLFIITCIANTHMRKNKKKNNILSKMQISYHMVEKSRHSYKFGVVKEIALQLTHHHDSVWTRSRQMALVKNDF